MYEPTSETTKNSRAPRRRVFLYARVSTLAQSDGPSIEEQFIAMSQFARARKMEVVGQDFDEASAFGPGSEKRPGFQAAMRAAERLGASLLVFKVNRLSRWLPTIAIIRACKLRVYSCDIGYVSIQRLRSEVAKAEAESEAKSKAQKASRALHNIRNPRSTLTNEMRRTGIVNNALRSDDNIRKAAAHLANVPGVDCLTHEQRVASLRSANIVRLMNTKTGETKPWDREAFRKRWPAIELEIALLTEDDISGSELV
ncbi:recombinase family protein [Marivita sp. GX14005]|uniref:recombinase family protein n=1 Tax=Marivita sp. GX14005 TaxID=2942276 RepID=UPI0020195FF8|nr:recombinase family protein [Marivita sp. GX14005]MCL3882993.1 recombinase family protein [Marivita sp. GX14005]